MPETATTPVQPEPSGLFGSVFNRSQIEAPRTASPATLQTSIEAAKQAGGLLDRLKARAINAQERQTRIDTLQKVINDKLGPQSAKLTTPEGTTTASQINEKATANYDVPLEARAGSIDGEDYPGKVNLARRLAPGEVQTTQQHIDDLFKVEQAENSTAAFAAQTIERAKQEEASRLLEQASKESENAAKLEQELARIRQEAAGRIKNHLTAIPQRLSEKIGAADLAEATIPEDEAIFSPDTIQDRRRRTGLLKLVKASAMAAAVIGVAIAGVGVRKSHENPQLLLGKNGSISAMPQLEHSPGIQDAAGNTLTFAPKVSEGSSPIEGSQSLPSSNTPAETVSSAAVIDAVQTVEQAVVANVSAIDAKINTVKKPGFFSRLFGRRGSPPVTHGQATKVNNEPAPGENFVTPEPAPEVAANVAAPVVAEAVVHPETSATVPHPVIEQPATTDTLAKPESALEQVENEQLTVEAGSNVYDRIKKAVVDAGLGNNWDGQANTLAALAVGLAEKNGNTSLDIVQPNYTFTLAGSTGLLGNGEFKSNWNQAVESPSRDAYGNVLREYIKLRPRR